MQETEKNQSETTLGMKDYTKCKGSIPDDIWIHSDTQEEVEGYKKNTARGCWQGVMPRWDSEC